MSNNKPMIITIDIHLIEESKLIYQVLKINLDKNQSSDLIATIAENQNTTGYSNLKNWTENLYVEILTQTSHPTENTKQTKRTTRNICIPDMKLIIECNPYSKNHSDMAKSVIYKLNTFLSPFSINLDNLTVFI
jgi:hypothetical protein